MVVVSFNFVVIIILVFYCDFFVCYLMLIDYREFFLFCEFINYFVFIQKNVLGIIGEMDWFYMESIDKYF